MKRKETWDDIAFVFFKEKHTGKKHQQSDRRYRVCVVKNTCPGSIERVVYLDG